MESERSRVVARSRRDREGLRRANAATAQLLTALSEQARAGVTTRALDEYAAAFMHRIGGEAIFHTQNGFPGCINTSVNDEAVHGVPGRRVLEMGDLLKIDCGIGLGGYCGDSTLSIAIGGQRTLSQSRRAVMETAAEALRQGIQAVRIGGHIGDIGHSMQTVVEAAGLRLLRQYSGHGIGKRLWEAPSVPAVGVQGTGPVIVEGLAITIEPIVVAGTGQTYVAPDGWTVVTADGSPAAQFEHTVLATARGAQVLSR